MTAAKLYGETIRFKKRIYTRRWKLFFITAFRQAFYNLTLIESLPLLDIIH